MGTSSVDLHLFTEAGSLATLRGGATVSDGSAHEVYRCIQSLVVFVCLFVFGFVLFVLLLGSQVLGLQAAAMPAWLFHGFWKPTRWAHAAEPSSRAFICSL